MRSSLTIVIVLAAGLLVLRYSGAANVPGTAPATRPAATQSGAPSDGWSGDYHRLGGVRLREDEPSRVSIVRVGDAYRLRGSRYDEYEFVEERPGLLWDRRHVLGTISRGTLTFETAGRLGRADPVTVLDVQFCYEYFYLFGTAGPEVLGQAPATRPAGPAGPAADVKVAPTKAGSGTSKQ
jgi:hypothetical protein